MDMSKAKMLGAVKGPPGVKRQAGKAPWEKYRKKRGGKK
jgi:hypothetical protein